MRELLIKYKINHILFRLMFFLCVAVCCSFIFFDGFFLSNDLSLVVVIANVLLVVFYQVVEDRIVKREIFKVGILGGLYIVVSYCFKNDIFISLVCLNFFGVLYYLLNKCYIKQSVLEYRIVSTYSTMFTILLITSIIVYNYLMVTKFLNNLILDLYIFYFLLGVKSVLIFITILTIVSIVISVCKTLQKPTDVLEKKSTNVRTLSNKELNKFLVNSIVSQNIASNHISYQRINTT
ncbi:hypothetical protein VSO92_12110 [Myroides pelagicus]|uniref:hypothetical protein n=1 Tax=Myroides pelagicus TaxID=270914 RepID=UPI002DB77A9F|nr:hypothetical protein [Myroides pelagicus]MEC4114845.1 hypothetical protein [Myroides pelagicus]